MLKWKSKVGIACCGSEAWKVLNTLQQYLENSSASNFDGILNKSFWWLSFNTVLGNLAGEGGGREEERRGREGKYPFFVWIYEEGNGGENKESETEKIINLFSSPLLTPIIKNGGEWRLIFNFPNKVNFNSPSQAHCKNSAWSHKFSRCMFSLLPLA